MFDALANNIIRSLLAPTCAACNEAVDEPLSGAICAKCAGSVLHVPPPVCWRCGDRASPHPAFDDLCTRCRDSPRAFSFAANAGRYEDAMKEMVHALKYQRRRMVAPWLSARMRRHGAVVLRGAHAVVPVPLHPYRQFRRGFNQADDLAMGLGLPVWRALRRCRAGPPQMSLPASERADNARGAYALAFGERLRRQRLIGAIVVVIDDVMTTGETVDACASVLKSAGAREVRVLTAARAAAARPLQQPQTLRLSTARR